MNAISSACIEIGLKSLTGAGSPPISKLGGSLGCIINISRRNDLAWMIDV